MNQKSKKAFTLIELLVVIAIIGVLATVSVLALSNARAKSRDAKRAGDMKQVQTALELFFNDKGRYPNSEEWATGQIYSTSTSGTSTYMQVIPVAPNPPDGSCASDQNDFIYSQTENGSSYSISLCLGGNTGSLASGPKCLTPGGMLDRDCSCGDPIVDSRDGQSYPTVKVGTQCWMAKNMNVGTMVLGNSSGQTNDSLLEKYCYDDLDARCVTYGALYTWHEALQLPSSCTSGPVDCDSLPNDPCCNFSTPRQGICPSGWHIPSDAEQYTLENYLTTPGNTCVANRSYDLDCSNAGQKLQNGGASVGFNAPLAGYRSPGWPFVQIGTYVFFWSSSVDGISARSRFLVNNYLHVYRVSNVRYLGFSVRCVRD